MRLPTRPFVSFLACVIGALAFLVPAVAQQGVVLDPQAAAMRDHEHSRIHSGKQPDAPPIPPGADMSRHETPFAQPRQSLHEALCSLAPDAVVTATINGGTPKLTEGRTLVYTDYEATVEDVLRSPTGSLLTSGDQIVVTRLGGAVPEGGKFTKWESSSRAPLEAGQRYLLLLRHLQATDTFVANSVGSAFALSDSTLRHAGANPLNVEELEDGRPILHVIADLQYALAQPCGRQGGRQ